MSTKTILLMLLIVAFQNSINAQVHVGPKAGINFSLFNVSKFEHPVVGIKNDVLYYVGLQAQIRLSKKISVQPEVIYIADAVSTYEDRLGNGTRGVLNSEDIKRIVVPLLVKIHAGHFGFYAGPQISLLLKVATFDNSIPAEVDVTDDSYTKTSFSGIFGIEYVFKHRFGIEARYQLGISNSSEANGKTGLTFPEGQNIKLNGFQTGLFYRFGKKPSKKNSAKN